MNFISIFRRLFLPLVVLLLAATADAQSAYDEIKADIDKAGGVYFMYPFDTPSATPAPKGYEPFYISHYGRHGAVTSSRTTSTTTWPRCCAGRAPTAS